MKNRSIRAKNARTSADVTTEKVAESGSKRKSRRGETELSRRTPASAKTRARANSSSSINELEKEIARLQSLIENQTPVKQTKLERLNQLRRCILYHSCLYYKFGTSVIEDSLWDSWAKELVELQQDKKLKKSGWNPQIFVDWTGESGFQLPLDEEWVKDKALQILKLFKDK